MKSWSLVVLLGITYATASSCTLLRASGEKGPPPPADTHQLLAADEHLIEFLRRVLVFPPWTVEELAQKLPAPAEREERDLGFGSRRLVWSFRGGHTDVRLLAWVATTEFRGRDVARLRVEQVSRDGDAWDRLAPELERAWNDTTATERRAARPAFTLQRVPDPRSGRPSFRAEREWPELCELLCARVAADLGAVPHVEPPPELRQACASMMDPFEELEVGMACGLAGLPTKGATWTAALVDAGRIDLLRSLLRSPNPEARVYAAHALHAQDALTNDDRGALATLGALPMRIWTCTGCIDGARDFAGALAALDL